MPRFGGAMGGWDDLTFERWGRRLFGSERGGYYAIGLTLTCLWGLTGPLTVLVFGRWLHSSLRVDLSTVAIYVLTLVGLRLWKRAFRSIRDRLKDGQRDSGREPGTVPLMDRRIWWAGFLSMVVVVVSVYLLEIHHLARFPSVVGTLPYRGANVGLLVWTFETIVSLLIFLAFVDGFAVMVSTCTLPWRFQNGLDVRDFHPDECGGLSWIGREYRYPFLIYFVMLAVGTLGRFRPNPPGVGIPYYLSIALAVWLFGVAMFLLPLLSIRSVVRKHRNDRLDDLAKRLSELDDDPSEVAETALQRIEAYHRWQTLRDMRTLPFDLDTLNFLLGGALLPLLAEILPRLML